MCDEYEDIIITLSSSTESCQLVAFLASSCHKQKVQKPNQYSDSLLILSIMSGIPSPMVDVIFIQTQSQARLVGLKVYRTISNSSCPSWVTGPVNVDEMGQLSRVTTKVADGLTYYSVFQKHGIYLNTCYESCMVRRAPGFYLLR